MLHVIIYLNRAGAVIFACLLNTGLIAVAVVAMALLLARLKTWSAATRCSLWWIAIALVIASPFAGGLLTQHQAAPMMAISAKSSVVHLLATRHAPDPGVPSSPRVGLSAVGLCLLCWMAAVCTQGTRILSSFFHLLRLKRTSTPAPPELEALFRCVRLDASVERECALCVSDEVTLPAVAGYFHPCVLLPAHLAASLKPEELREILFHELAHVARYDDWAIALQRVIETAYICHPLVWYLGRRLRLDREMACDDRVAAAYEARQYAACLAKVAQTHSFIANAVLVPFFESKSDLLARVEKLLDRTRTHTPRVSVKRLLFASATMLLLGLIGLQVRPIMAFPAPQTPPPRPDSKSGIDSIVLTGRHGQSFMFGEWSGYSFGESGREPGTLEYKKDSKVYVIHDKQVLAEAQQIVQPMEELGRKQAELGERQSKLGEEQSALGEQQERLSERPVDAAAQAKIREKLTKVRAKIDQIKSETGPKTASDLQAELADLQSELGDAQSEMGSEQEKAGEQQGRLGEQQGKLGEQQAELGKQQSALGAQQAAESKRAMQKLEKLIRDAESRGLAQQVH